MFPLRISTLLCVILVQACVTAESSNQAAIGGAVWVFSHLAKSAQSGDVAAKRSWCEAFAKVRERTEQKDTTQYSDEQLIKELTPSMHALMRNHGYALHQQQINIVIKDALNVSRNPTALHAMVESCN